MRRKVKYNIRNVRAAQQRFDNSEKEKIRLSLILLSTSHTIDDLKTLQKLAEALNANICWKRSETGRARIVSENDKLNMDHTDSLCFCLRRASIQTLFECTLL